MNILFRVELPFFFTILISLVAYQANNIATILTDSPILAYSYKVISEQNKNGYILRELECNLVNLNRNEAYRSLELLISYKSSLPDPKEVSNPKIIPIAPSSMLIPHKETHSVDNLTNVYHLPVIQPRGEYILFLSTITHSSIKEFPKIYLESNESIRLIHNNLEVFLVKNQILINIWLLIFWVFVIILYLIILQRHKS